MTAEGDKDRSVFQAVVGRHLDKCGIDTHGSVLVIGGSLGDSRVLMGLGFSNITLTNLDDGTEPPEVPGITYQTADAEQLDIPDRSYDVVFVHESLHHCRSPHTALCEMIRVSRRHVIMLEPNDSAGMSLLTRLGFSAPYETAAVIANSYRRGGVRDTHIPNYIYRWSGHEVAKTVSSYLAERQFSVTSYPYWDFNLRKSELQLRGDTRLGAITKVVGPDRFLAMLRRSQGALNRVPFLRRQGNKFFACITVSDSLNPWLEESTEGVVFNRSYDPRVRSRSL